MGSVPHLYTTGDNDPEIEPVRYYRHYLYCDACGSFELDPWVMPENHEGLEKNRRRLAMAALLSLPLVLVPGWLLLGLFPAPAFLVILAAAMVIAPVLRGLAPLLGEESVRKRWRFLKMALLALPAVALVQLVATELLPPWLVLVAGLILIAALLVARGILGSKIESVGMRCRRCAATYAHGSPFFNDLEANPRHLTVADVPRPLGVSPFRRGESVS